MSRSIAPPGEGSPAPRLILRYPRNSRGRSSSCASTSSTTSSPASNNAVGRARTAEAPPDRRTADHRSGDRSLRVVASGAAYRLSGGMVAFLVADPLLVVLLGPTASG